MYVKDAISFIDLKTKEFKFVQLHLRAIINSVLICY